MRDLSNEQVMQVSKNGIDYLQFRVLLDLGVKHAYTLKCDNLLFKEPGFGKPMYLESYKKLCDCLELDSNGVVLPMQNHTDNIVSVYRNTLYSELKNVDGVLTNRQNLIISTTNADCILYLLYDPKKKVIGNIHSGWRGSYQRIIEKAIEKMVNDFGCETKDIIICICPSIRKCCFEVDEDIRDMFYERFCFLDNINKFILNGYKKGKYFIDTVGINNVLLGMNGIRNENIYDCRICSCCNSDLVHSYRVEGSSYKLATAVISL